MQAEKGLVDEWWTQYEISGLPQNTGTMTSRIENLFLVLKYQILTIL